MSIHEKKTRLHVRAMAKTRGEQEQKVSIEIPEFNLGMGEFVAVTGANGSGKSTFLDMLGLILSPDTAKAFMINEKEQVDPTRLSSRKKIRIRRRYFAYVLQTGGLLEFLTIRDNIRLAARLGMKNENKIESTAQQLGIEKILDKRPGRVSGGQRQKAAIARALIQEPDIILADEPTSAMDPPSAAKLMKTFQSLTQKAGTGLIMVTHDTELARSSADRSYHFRIKESEKGEISSILTKGTPG